MDSLELTLTALVIDHAKGIRNRDISGSLTDLPPLGKYIDRAVTELVAWHPFVVEAIGTLSTRESFDRNDQEK